MDDELETRLGEALRREADFCAAREPASLAARCRYPRAPAPWQVGLAVAALIIVGIALLLRTPQTPPRWQPEDVPASIVTPGAADSAKLHAALVRPPPVPRPPRPMKR
ncbi:MAG: hypothetical protein ACI8W8_002504 [Rhodothermales bacterium]|jgi:hypothetical protein